MKSFAHISRSNAAKLWTHQKDAVKFSVDHLNSNSDTCLVRMPTGTGKTGVIASLTALSCSGSSLVITPWAYLRNQLIADIKERFWDKCGIQNPTRRVRELKPSVAEATLQSNPNAIFVTTFATLSTLRKEYSEAYELLAKTISFVIVDECHYEPAVGWGRSVKELNTKTILLTATPYRNDLKLFRITDPKSQCFHFTHEDAVSNNIIRDVKFEKLSCVNTDRLQTQTEIFLGRWISLLKSKSLPSSNPRAIICCKDVSDIEDVVTTLRSNKNSINAIGIHDRFQGRKEEYLYSSVPDPQEEDAAIWVHQNKLTEGFDDNRFCVTALFTSFSNDRKLIQQIGRILRKSGDDSKDACSLILSPKEISPQVEWESYRNFERDQELRSAQHYKEAVEKLLSLQPEIEYFSGRFLKKFDPSTLDSDAQVIVPPTAIVRKKVKSFDLSDYIENCTDTLNLEDATILGPNLNEPCQKRKDSALWVYASIANSSRAYRRSLYEIRLETHCVVVTKNYVFIADSAGNLPMEYIDEHTLPVGAGTLSKYFDESFTPTNASTQNTIPFDSSVRGVDIRGSNLSLISPSITDRIHICRTTRGYSNKERRYLNIGNGRVRKEADTVTLRDHDYKSFISWAKSTAKALDSSTAPSAFLSRYMPACDPPDKIDPGSISFDMFRSDVVFYIGGGDEQYLCQKASVEVSPKNGGSDTFLFKLSFLPVESVEDKKTDIDFHLKYKPEKRKFWITKEDSSSSITISDSTGIKPTAFSDYFNRNQDVITVCMKDGSSIYSGRNFYQIDYSYFEKYLLQLIEIPNDAPACKNEKGTEEEIKKLKANNTKQFPKGSLFSVISQNKIGLPFAPSTIICDDLGSEAADFVCVDFKSKSLAFVHAKANKGNSKISASALHDIVSQASKNIVYMSPNIESPKGVESWARGKKWNSTQIPRLFKHPAGQPTASALWKKIKRDIIDQPERNLYVVLATAGCVNKAELTKAIKDDSKRTAETSQLVHLLDGLNSQARQIGVSLLVKEIPFDKK
ncbi:MAG: DEAD/DEAH box helicase family protein [Gammaproteobacteria bacterium]|nr:DEAD/DEAH box helicase family protein [Gammaproteobacteria bacterium]